ncbi:hypothetical protein J27TS8_25230 [Robertmurraya siralis]|uniref:Serine protease n=1 Tax=Robertmurraya siralis TaxID=77777 RepID=A0A919WIF0_9BACI|nr:hypothetical protein [Robertmurraya siralis]GIN62530.1 hypothetical protein J27TS8_25230 [Robertmurraya siralis]
MSVDILSERLLYITVRIEYTLSDGYSTGYGFFFNYPIGDENLPAIVTNKHVIEGAYKEKFILHKNNENMDNLTNLKLMGWN